ncbi:MAG: ribonuclease P protein component [Gammaproteobacteria bacterium]|nr:ribonuclease P protein component [Gammaproteobacteria bacterium]
MEKPEYMSAFSDTLFPRENRLTQGAEFDLVFKKANRSSDRFFTVLYRQNSLPSARLGMAIAKKRINKATSRNRLKRLVRESFRRSKEKLSGVDIVIMARSTADETNNQILFNSLEGHWQKIAQDNKRN